MIRQQVEEAVLGAVGELWSGADTRAIRVEPAREKEHGDLATNAALVLAKAAKLMREAADDSTWAQGKGDFLHWAIQIEEIISCDDGEAGIGPSISKMAQ